MTTVADHFFHLSPISPARARLEEAERFFLEGNLNEALAAAQQAWREYSEDPDVFRMLSYLHMARGEYPPAAQAAYRAVAIDGGNPASYAMLVQVYVVGNNPKLAQEALQVALARLPESEHGSLQVLAADLYFRLKRTREAVTHAKRALEWNPQDAYSKALLGQHYLRVRAYAEAVPLLADVVVAYPQRWDYLRDYGVALLNNGQYAGALIILTRSFKLQSSDAAVQQNLWLAQRLNTGNAFWYWQWSLFLYTHAWLGWLLTCFGAGCVLYGLEGIVTTFSWNADIIALLKPCGLFLGGLALLLLTQSGPYLHFHKGKRFEATLRRSLQEVKE